METSLIVVCLTGHGCEPPEGTAKSGSNRYQFLDVDEFEGTFLYIYFYIKIYIIGHIGHI